MRPVGATTRPSVHRILQREVDEARILDAEGPQNLVAHEKVEWSPGDRGDHLAERDEAEIAVDPAAAFFDRRVQRLHDHHRERTLPMPTLERRARETWNRLEGGHEEGRPRRKTASMPEELAHGDVRQSEAGEVAPNRIVENEVLESRTSTATASVVASLVTLATSKIASTEVPCALS